MEIVDEVVTAPQQYLTGSTVTYSCIPAFFTYAGGVGVSECTDSGWTLPSLSCTGMFWVVITTTTTTTTTVVVVVVSVAAVSSPPLHYHHLPVSLLFSNDRMPRTQKLGSSLLGTKQTY